MGVFYEEIPNSLREWIMQQKMFCVATAPLSKNGHVNVSPKGGEYFGIIDSRTFWYLDLSGSGNETIAHLHENGRVTIMLNAFEGPPKIVRLWGYGEVLEHSTPEFTTFVESNKVELLPGTRSIIVVHIHQVGSSCGFSVPYYDFKDFRPVLNDLWRKKEQKFLSGKKEESMERYWAYKSAWSIDGLPGMKLGMATAKKEKIAPLKKFVGPLAPPNGNRFREGVPLPQVILVAVLCVILGMFLATFQSDIRQGLKSLSTNIDIDRARNLLHLNSR